MDSRSLMTAVVMILLVMMCFSGASYAVVLHQGVTEQSPRVLPVGASEGTIGSGDGRIHIIPSLSSPSVKNGERLTIQAVIKATDGVASVTAQIQKEGLTWKGDIPVPHTSCNNRDGVLPVLPIFSLNNILNPPLATLTLQGAPINLGGTNASGTMGLWQTEWAATGLEEAYYRVHITVTDSVGHTYTDSSLRFSDPIAGNNVVGSTAYPNDGMRRLDAATLELTEDSLQSAVIDAASGYAYFGTGTDPGGCGEGRAGRGGEPAHTCGRPNAEH